MVSATLSATWSPLLPFREWWGLRSSQVFSDCGPRSILVTGITNLRTRPLGFPSRPAGCSLYIPFPGSLTPLIPKWCRAPGLAPHVFSHLL